MDKDLEINITKKCNRKCIYCNFTPFYKKQFNKKRNDYDLNLLFKTIKKAKNEKIKNISIVGGEPTLHKNLPEIIYIAKKNKFKDIALITNGLKLSNESYLENLVKLGMTSATLNLPHHKKEKFEYLTGKKNSFHKIIKAIENMNKKNILITAFIVVNKLNYKELKEISDFYFKKKIRNFVFAYIRYTGRAFRNYKELKIEMRKTVPYVKKAAENLLKKDCFISFENFLPCILTGYEKYMSDFYIESKPNIGKIYHESSKNCEDLYEISYRDNIKSEKCKECIYYNNCIGLYPGYFKIFGDREIKPVKYEQKD